ncbi:MAG: hypothetical protein EXQ74_07340 [Thermoleophilia bacterium]|nr:hypothetical protein [Thermoleophilia bacterium]
MRLRDQRGQATPLVLAAAAIVVACALGIAVAGAVNVAVGGARLAADLAALSGGRALLDALPAAVGDPWNLRARLTAAVQVAVRESAHGSGAQVEWIRLEGEGRIPFAVEVRVRRAAPMGLTVTATARAGLSASAAVADGGPVGWAIGGGYSGPLVYRDGKPVCPIVAAAFDQMDHAAHASGLDLVVVSGFRSDAEQAILFARHPDPTWVASPGHSRHRNSTELDLDVSGGVSPWLTRHGGTFGFVQRYAWEAWHWGYRPGCGAGQPDATATVGASTAAGGLPMWVPSEYRAPVVRAALVAGIAPALLAALIETESAFDPRLVSRSGARGIAQLLPGTARRMGVDDPFDPDQAIPGAARLVASGIREFGSIPLALAAYTAGAGAVHRYGGIPPFPETRAYVATVLALAGQGAAITGGGSAVVLVRAGDRLA